MNLLKSSAGIDQKEAKCPSMDKQIVLWTMEYVQPHKGIESWFMLQGD